ncbi:hypothetical protein GYMLUDRAFT_76810 [Collybiopsis luxurians FD-317 M1]|uniref:Uncharacterized protein n=1 Tax=Collybiopsis luxurians FD-317 M1 TaxID=944289 RepID=A0A0D0CA54_9AGAR|nr:hypothetical protein GYMLUDRAFT_76810 [Collybiopsis luxurians FD-317 M1]
MDKDDLAIFLELGYVIKITVIGSIVTFILFGFYLGVAGFVIHLLIQKRVQGRPQQIFLIIQCCLLLSSIFTFIDSCATPLSKIQAIVPQPDSGGIDSLEEKFSTVENLQAPSLFFYITNWFSGGINVSL